MIHRRGEIWDELPFESMAEVADFATELNRILMEAVPEPPREVRTQITYEDSKTVSMSADEFRDELSHLPPLAEAIQILVISAYVDDADPAAIADTSNFSVFLFYEGVRPRTSLSVEGRKLTAVEGVNATAKRAIDQRVKTRRRNKEEESRREKEERPAERSHVVESPPALDGSGSPRLVRILRDPWTITIGGGLVVGVIILMLAS